VSEPVYKWLNGREATHISGYRYRLGQWRAVKGPLVPCENGLHLMRPEHLSRWIARDLFVAEYEGEVLDAGDKIIVRKARIVEHLTGWNERTARLAAADFAEAVLPIYEARHPDDDRPRKAIEAARAFANGEIDAAAWAAAGAAATAAASAAAWAAAGAAARAAAGDAAGDAARAAAGDAAGDAARAAATAAAWAAARDAAWDAARAAAWAAQGQIILDYAYGRRG
jgi:hypothetical protein